ncbi:hypothetical protein KAT80_00175 [Candidatus Pacearchaeota archaeon]|nr:hypothetical protein [Candidatus Pacearchaeota archaeon]
MIYKKYLIIASKKDKAGINITTNLSQFRKNPVLSSMADNPSFDFYLVDDEIIYTKSLNLEKINKYDFVIFASKHKSEKKEKTLCVHAPGNWREAQLGGEKTKVCKTSALFQKQIFEKLNSNVKEHSLDKKYKVTLECTHHGPLIDKPCIFIEIGSTENQWIDRKAGFIIAKTINQIIKEFKPNPYNEVAVGIGGPHYCPNFNKVQLNSNIALSHVIPQYALPLDQEMIKQAIGNTEEEVDFALLDWKGLGNAEQRKQVTEILDKLYVKYKKTSEVGK